MPNDTLVINEIFYSIQGESSWAGLPCVFVRLTGCHLRCGYCDTEYAFYDGKRLTLDEILGQVAHHGCKLVEITGGEPLLQPNVYPLMSRLCETGYTVLLETSGCIAVDKVDSRVIKIMDFKTPSSGEVLRNLYDNVDHLTPTDEVKFVIGDRADYEWTKDLIEKFELTDRCKLLMSPVFGQLEPQQLAEWILADRLPVRFQTQLHKIIWSPETRGV